MSSEYYTEVNEIPIKINVPLFNKIFQSFLDSNLKKVRVKTEQFNNRKLNYIANAMSRYCKKHSVPIKVHYISEIIYLERI